MVPAVKPLNFVRSTVDRLKLTKRHIILLAVMFVISAGASAGYVIYDYNNKSFSKDYKAEERLQRNTEMNDWVAEESGENADNLVTVILSARSRAFQSEMTYELAIYRLDQDAFRSREGTIVDEKKGTLYTMDLVRGYSKTPASKDEALTLIGTGTAVTNKHTGQHLSIDIQWLNEPKQGDTAP